MASSVSAQTTETSSAATETTSATEACPSDTAAATTTDTMATQTATQTTDPNATTPTSCPPTTSAPFGRPLETNDDTQVVDGEGSPFVGAPIAVLAIGMLAAFLAGRRKK